MSAQNAKSSPQVSSGSTLVHSFTVACDGGNGGLGHPRVFLTFAKGERETVCPYCSHTFVLAEGAKDHGH